MGDYEVVFANAKGKEENIRFNFCSHVHRECTLSGGDETQSFATLYGHGKCTPLTGPYME